MTDSDNELPAYTGNLKTVYYQAYFGDHWGYYLPIMLDFERGKKFSFNVWAFFCGMLWQLYRRLYGMMLLFLTIIIIESIFRRWVIQYWNLEGDSLKLINLIVMLIYGTIYGYTGNYFLMRKAQEKITRILATESEEEIILEKLKKAGSGNSLGVTLILVSIFFVFMVVIFHNKIWG